ncbi:MAG: efflux RND transporter periplasmic adaptor subunit [Pseudomonadota bacterium]
MFWALVGVCFSLTAQEQPLGVVAVIAEKGPVIEEIPLTGTVNSTQFVRLSAAVAGLVSAVAVDAGSKVEQGDTLVRLDDEIARFDWQAATAEVQRLEAQLADSKRRLDEVQELAAENSIAATEVASREARVTIDQAALATAKAGASRRLALLQRHRVRAPFSGVVRSKETEVGAWVTPGTAVLELVATEALRIDFQTPQEHFAKIREDTVVLLRDADGQFLPLEVDAAVPVTDPVARTFLLRVNVIDMPHLTPGMSANGLLRLESTRQSVSIPRDALIRYPDGRTTVWIVSKDGSATRVKEQAVTIGSVSGGMVEVITGLLGGEQVVVRGNEALRNGQEVQVVLEAQT